jgi:hypothetical protein
VKKLNSFLAAPSFLTACCALALSVTCGPTSESTKDDPSFADAAPSSSALVINTGTVTVSTAVMAASLLTTDASQPNTSDPAAHPALLLTGSNGLAQQVNGAIQPILDLVETSMVDGTQPVLRTPTSRAWQVTQNGLTYQFTIVANKGRYGWKLVVKEASAADPSFVPIMAGRFTKGYSPRHGTGIVSFDFDAYYRVAGARSLTPAAGALFMAFAQTTVGATQNYRVVNFSPSTAVPVLPTAYYATIRLFPLNANDVEHVFIRAGGYTDALGSLQPDSALEQVTVRYRRFNRLGGWVKAVLTAGDVPAGEAYIVRTCWQLDPTTDADALTIRRAWSCPMPYDPTAATHPGCLLIRAMSIPATTAEDLDDPDDSAGDANFRRDCFTASAMLDPVAATALSDIAAADPDPTTNLADDSPESIPGAPASASAPVVSDQVPTTQLKGDGSD